MHRILFEYELHPTTWVYISSLMILGIFFKFRRLWSVRNLDLIALVLLAPGLLAVARPNVAELGYVWLIVVSAFFLLRLLLDTVMVRRPMLEPNLSADGLAFTCVALILFLMAKVLTGSIDEKELAGALRTGDQDGRPAAASSFDLSRHGPGYPLFYTVAGFANRVFSRGDAANVEDKSTEAERQAAIEAAAARTAAILGHLAVVAGLVLIGLRHYDNIQTGVAAASLYLLLPYTAQTVNQVDHVVPAALMVWAVQCYRRPVFSGILVGLACGVIYYPLFLLPLWCGFYWRRGLWRFAAATLLTILVLVSTLALHAQSDASFGAQVRQMFGWTTLMPEKLYGFWEEREPAFRIPVMVAFAAMSISFALWPAQKNLGTLISCSAAVLVGAQFWHPQWGGVYMGWYLPLLILTMFRPNLEDRVAATTVREIRWRWSPLKSAPAPAPPAPA